MVRAGEPGEFAVDASARRLLGREDELAALDELIIQLGKGQGGALLIRGEAGIGKSALLEVAQTESAAKGLRVLSTTGIQSEARLPFAGLHELLRPILALSERLKEPQRSALLAAFGMSNEASADPLLVGFAVLALISDAAEVAPVLILVDDAHWLDEPSCATLAFVARRLADDRALMLVAVRDTLANRFDDAELPEMQLGRLDFTVAGALMDAWAPGLERVARARLLAEAAGNPLALVELPRAFRSQPLGSLELEPMQLPLTDRLERAFRVQVSVLPSATHSVLLVAAADDESAIGEVLHAASVLEGVELTVDDLAPAIAARLVEKDETDVRFRHPLVRSAIYQEATRHQRQAAHRAIAASLDNQPDRRVWHRAAGSEGPDEQVAAELDVASLRVERRGAIDIAIDASRRAAYFSENPVDQGRRLVRAARIAFESGRVELGALILTAAEPLDLPHEERTLLSWLRECYQSSGWSGATRIGAFVDLVERIRSTGHPDLVLQSLEDVATRCHWGNPPQEIRNAVVSAAEELSLPESDPTLLAVLAQADPVHRGAVVNDRIARVKLDEADPLGMHFVGSAASAVWAFDVAIPFLECAKEGLRRMGRLGLLAQALATQSWARALCAQGASAASTAEEASSLGRETGQLRWALAAELASATAAADCGDADRAESMARAAEAVLISMGANPMLAMVRFALGRNAVAQQRYEEGFEELRRTLDPADPCYQPFAGAWGLAELIEAAVNLGRVDVAKSHLKMLERMATTTRGPLLRAELAFARPLVADDSTAEKLYRKAIERDLTRWPGYRSRMLLLYGVWLRRQRRVIDSRAPLRAARDGLEGLGFATLADRATSELRAAGESDTRRSSHALKELTAQETQVANLVATGDSNRAVAAKLFISPATVEYHLGKIYQKLGVTSRTQLATRVREPALEPRRPA